MAASMEATSEQIEENTTRKKVFVAGSTGRTGRRIVEQLLSRGYGVRAGALDLDKARNSLPRDPNVEFVSRSNWDLQNPNLIASSSFLHSGLSCSYNSNSTNIEKVNLSSNALTGVISEHFGMFTQIQYLDLSYNDLTGKIPKVLGTLSSLRVLNLTGNNLNGPVPDSLIQMSHDESLILILEGNPNLTCTNGTPCKLTADNGKAKFCSRNR